MVLWLIGIHRSYPTRAATKDETEAKSMTAKVILKSTYRISSNKRPQRLPPSPPPYPNFETVKGGAY